MHRRAIITSGVAILGGFAGCLKILGGGKEVIVDRDFNQTSQHKPEVSKGETLRVEVTPLDPHYQLYMIIADAETMNEGQGLSALSELNEVDTEMAQEVTARKETRYVVAVGWFEDNKQLESNQYHLRITVG